VSLGLENDLIFVKPCKVDLLKSIFKANYAKRLAKVLEKKDKVKFLF
jgi:hypothetical protein